MSALAWLRNCISALTGDTWRSFINGCSSTSRETPRTPRLRWKVSVRSFSLIWRWRSIPTSPRILRTMTRHQAAIRELSTPVIKVYERILLLPIVGTVDTQRAHQIMETVLLQVVEQQAKVMILDIAGVPVVDTKVADHILKTTAAVQLLGAQTILTGISASVARTVVQLGVEITRMHTRSKLAEGIELALSIIGKKISPKTNTSESEEPDLCLAAPFRF